MPRELSQNPRTVINRIRRQTSFWTYFNSNIYEKIKNRCRSDKNYMGLPYMDKKEWSRFLDETFMERAILFNNWQQSGRMRKLAPSIDRKDTSEGYIPDNVRWLTLSENSKNQIPWTRLKTRCKNGHPFDKIQKDGRRVCDRCSKALHHRLYLKRKNRVHPEWRTFPEREAKWAQETKPDAE